MAANWTLKGYLIGSCNCDWGCPCTFNARPTYTKCQGAYTWCATTGAFENVDLADLHLSLYADSPGPLHLGNVTSGFTRRARSTRVG